MSYVELCNIMYKKTNTRPVVKKRRKRGESAFFSEIFSIIRVGIVFACSDLILPIHCSWKSALTRNGSQRWPASAANFRHKQVILSSVYWWCMCACMWVTCAQVGHDHLLESTAVFLCLVKHRCSLCDALPTHIVVVVVVVNFCTQFVVILNETPRACSASYIYGWYVETATGFPPFNTHTRVIVYRWARIRHTLWCIAVCHLIDAVRRRRCVCHGQTGAALAAAIWSQPSPVDASGPSRAEWLIHPWQAIHSVSSNSMHHYHFPNWHRSIPRLLRRFH